jgi:hypothetical protein
MRSGSLEAIPTVAQGCVSRSALDIGIGQQPGTMKDGEYVDASVSYAINQSVVALQDLADFFSPEFSNDLAGERKDAQTFY